MTFKKSISVQHNSQDTLSKKTELEFSQLLIDRLIDAVFCIQLNARFVYVNDAGCNLVGYGREELLCMSMQDLNWEFLHETWLHQWDKLRKQGYLDLEFQFPTAIGQNSPMGITIIYKDGSEYICVLIRDIHKQQETSPTNTTEIENSIYPSSIYPTNPPQLTKVFQFIESNYHQQISLCDVALAVGYSSAYLTDLVRRHTGQTVNHWIIQRRMVAACALLLGTNQTVNQIAECIGYQHQGHFFRQFRQYYGTTPQVWRKAQRG